MRASMLTSPPACFPHQSVRSGSFRSVFLRISSLICSSKNTACESGTSYKYVSCLQHDRANIDTLLRDGPAAQRQVDRKAAQ